MLMTRMLKMNWPMMMIANYYQQFDVKYLISPPSLSNFQLRGSQVDFPEFTVAGTMNLVRPMAPVDVSEGGFKVKFESMT